MVAFARPLASDNTEEERKKARTYISLIHDVFAIENYSHNIFFFSR